MCANEPRDIVVAVAFLASGKFNQTRLAPQSLGAAMMARSRHHVGSCSMPHFTTDDGVKLFYEEVGSGVPIVFVHEFAGDSRSWELQVRYFCRRYRCITFNARGYPPSDVPEDGEKYSQEHACEDIRAVIDALKIDKAHVVG